MPYKVTDKIVNNTGDIYETYDGLDNVYRNGKSVEEWIPIFLTHGRSIEKTEEELSTLLTEFENISPYSVEWDLDNQVATRTRIWSSKEVYDLQYEIKELISKNLDDGLVKATILEKVVVD